MRDVIGAVVAVSVLAAGPGAWADGPPTKAPPAANETMAPASPPAEQRAQVPAPHAEAVKAVWSYYLNGKGSGVVLADARMCLEVGRAGPEKHECVKEVGPEGVKVGSAIRVWQAYLVPNGDKVEDITVQLKLGDVVRETRDVAVTGATMRSRVWTDVRLPKPGKWTITLARGGKTLKVFEVQAWK